MKSALIMNDTLPAKRKRILKARKKLEPAGENDKAATLNTDGWRIR